MSVDIPIKPSSIKPDRKKRTTEEFKKEFFNLFPDSPLDLSKVEFKTLREKVCVICPIHGEYYTKSQSLLNGHGCKKCAKSCAFKTTQEFLREYHIKFPEHQNDFSKFVYVNCNKLSSVLCKLHGFFKQAPAKLLQGHGCKECGKQKHIAKISKRFNTNTFILKFNFEYPSSQWDMSEFVYTTSVTEAIVKCSKHGPFYITPQRLMNGYGCARCSIEIRSEKKKLTQDQFLNRFYLRYPESEWDLSKFVYFGMRTRSVAICRIHGEVLIHPESLLNGCGCLKCYFENKSGYSLELFDKDSDLATTKGILYVAKVQSENMSCIKIGITKNSPNERFNNMASKGTKITLIQSFESTMRDVYEKEQKTKFKFMDFRIIPSKEILKNGNTECFDIRVLPEMLEHIFEYYHPDDYYKTTDLSFEQLVASGY